MRSSCLVSAVLLVLLGAAPQDPQKARIPSPPVGKNPLPPVPEPQAIPVDRRDLGRSWLPQSPIEGFWQLSSWSVNGSVQKEGLRAFLAVGRAHLSLQVLELPNPDIGPLIQAGTRSYQIEEGVLVTTALVGFDNYGDRKIHLEPIGLVERREMSFVGGHLRIAQSSGDWLEFERIE
ncbi:MAG: hypothetical protein U1F36_17370 [Planctomycetota bacterium]